MQKYFVSKIAVKVLESSLLQQYAKIHQRTFLKVSFKVFYFSFDILISIYCMNLISLPMNKAMLGHRFKYQALYVPTISRKFKAIGRKIFLSQLFEMRISTLKHPSDWIFKNFIKNFYFYFDILIFMCRMTLFVYQWVKISYDNILMNIKATFWSSLASQRFLKWKCWVKISKRRISRILQSWDSHFKQLWAETFSSDCFKFTRNGRNVQCLVF